MILYVDASAFVKRYVTERGSEAVTALMEEAAVVATSIVSRAEVGAALAGAVRGRVLDEPDGRRARLLFAQEWPDIARIPVTEGLVALADALAWEHGLRGYDAVQLASAANWQDMVGSDVVLATFDKRLWNAALRTGLRPWPPQLETSRDREHDGSEAKTEDCPDGTGGGDDSPDGAIQACVQEVGGHGQASGPQTSRGGDLARTAGF